MRNFITKCCLETGQLKGGMPLIKAPAAGTVSVMTQTDMS